MPPPSPATPNAGRHSGFPPTMPLLACNPFSCPGLRCFQSTGHVNQHRHLDGATPWILCEFVILGVLNPLTVEADADANARTDVHHAGKGYANPAVFPSLGAPSASVELLTACKISPALELAWPLINVRDNVRERVYSL